MTKQKDIWCFLQTKTGESHCLPNPFQVHWNLVTLKMYFNCLRKEIIHNSCLKAGIKRLCMMCCHSAHLFRVSGWMIKEFRLKNESQDKQTLTECSHVGNNRGDSLTIPQLWWLFLLTVQLHKDLSYYQVWVSVCLWADACKMSISTVCKIVTLICPKHSEYMQTLCKNICINENKKR